MKFFITYGHHILDYFYLFKVYLINFRLKLINFLKSKTNIETLKYMEYIYD